jgi:hypothetical protein
MHAPDKVGDLVRHPEPVMRLFHDQSLPEQFIE